MKREMHLANGSGFWEEERCQPLCLVHPCGMFDVHLVWGCVPWKPEVLVVSVSEDLAKDFYI